MKWFDKLVNTFVEDVAPVDIKAYSRTFTKKMLL